nr:MAG TPA: hypothetical protein [Caudoviricetes sp.]
MVFSVRSSSGNLFCSPALSVIYGSPLEVV